MFNKLDACYSINKHNAILELKGSSWVLSTEYVHEYFTSEELLSILNKLRELNENLSAA